MPSTGVELPLLTKKESEALRNAYYKKLRRAQKKRRMERKKKRVVQQQAMKETPVVKPNEHEKKMICSRSLMTKA